MKNRSESWQATVIKKEISDNSSISSEMDYVDVCRQAVQDDQIFNKFKSSTQYRAVLEHIDYKQGATYLDLISENSPIMSHLKVIKQRELGSPFRYWYRGVGLISPTQIRYAKVLQDLEILFGNLESLHIAEIGAGYGGQAVQILTRWNISSYSIYDLYWPGLLISKYMQKTELVSESVLSVNPNVHNPYFDLVISNYAFSELFRDVQDRYLSDVILKSKSGYVIFNQIHHDSQSSYTPDEFASMIPGAQIFAEVPETFDGNVLIVWGHQRDNLPNSLFLEK